MERSQRTGWFHRAKWGVFMHFLAEAPGGNNADWGHMDIASWNRRVENFNVEKLAAQLHKVEAGYFFLTLGQNSGYFCSPNATYDRLTGRDSSESRCSRRDLVGDMCHALQKYDIPVMVYLPSHAPMHDVQAAMALKCVPPWNFAAWSPKNREDMAFAQDDDPRLRTFQRNWEAVISEWSQRWGRQIRGWWFDGCYFAEKIYDFADEPNFSSFAAAARAGNPDSMVCWNPGITGAPRTISKEEDYTSGEINEPESLFCAGRWVRQAQAHLLSYVGQTWGNPELRLSADTMLAWTRKATDAGGVFTWDVPYDHRDGTLSPETMALLADFSRGMRNPPPRAAAIPLMDVKMSSPLGDTDAVCSNFELEITNPHDHAIAGRIDFRFSREHVFSPLPPLDFSLLPGAGLRRELTLRQVAEYHDLLFAELSCSCHGVAQSFRFRCKGRITADDRGHRFPIVDMESGTLGEIGMTVERERLCLAGTVYDPAPQVDAIPWKKSCLELFLMPENDFSEMAQLFLTPAAGGREAALTWHRGGAYVPVPGTVFTVEPFSGGYVLTMAIPLSLIRSPAALRLEVQLSVFRDGKYWRQTLFGSPSPFTSPEFYALIRP